MISQRSRDVKHAQKEAFIRKEFVTAFCNIVADAKELHGMYVSKIILSPKRGGVTILFHGVTPEEFREKMGTLILYKPSLRTALAHALKSRYTPEIIFKYDELYDKQYRLDQLLSGITMRDTNDDDSQG